MRVSTDQVERKLAASSRGVRLSSTEPASLYQPSCFMAHPAFQIFVMCRILSPSNSMT
jgi:hypothetical protein